MGKTQTDEHAGRSSNTSADSYAYFKGQFMPLSEAKVSVATHALNYGTGLFEGIRAYWNEEQGQLYGLKVREHYERMERNARILKMKLPHTPDELTEITRKLLEMNGARQNTYIRPLLFKGTESIGVRLAGMEDDFTIFTVPMGDYLDTSKGLHVCVSSWRRLDDNAIPGRTKATGAYVSSALVVEEAQTNGYDDAIVLNPNGEVSEGSASNLFIVRDGVLITTGVTEGILEGITRLAILQLATDLGYEHQIRPIDRTELYIADEAFYAGTGVQVAPITKIDHRPVGTGEPGPITKALQELYFDAVRGKVPKYMDWLTPVYNK